MLYMHHCVMLCMHHCLPPCFAFAYWDWTTGGTVLYILCLLGLDCWRYSTVHPLSIGTGLLEVQYALRSGKPYYHLTNNGKAFYYYLLVLLMVGSVFIYHTYNKTEYCKITRIAAESWALTEAQGAQLETFHNCCLR